MVSIDGHGLASDVVWVGMLPGQLCRGADQVKARLDQIRAEGRTVDPEVLAKGKSAFLIDPHVEPPAAIPELHQIAVVHDGVVQEIRDYRDRATAEAAFEAMDW